MNLSPDQILIAVKNTVIPIINRSPQIFAALQNEKPLLPAKESGVYLSSLLNTSERPNYGTDKR